MGATWLLTWPSLSCLECFAAGVDWDEDLFFDATTTDSDVTPMSKGETHAPWLFSRQKR